MDYKKTAIRPSNTRAISKTLLLKGASQLSTPSLLWLLVKRHKVAILATGNIVLVLNWAVPAWTEIVKSFL